jgi:hypothetical protein
MKYIITENQIDKLQNHIQNLIDGELNNLREESQEWGLGEMDDIYELNSIDTIVIDSIVTNLGISVYLNIYVNSEREDFNNIRSEIQYRISEWIPNVKLFINNIIRYY